MQYVPAWTLIPFAIMLLMIAVVPLISEKFWESNRNKLYCTLIVAVPIAVYMLCTGFSDELAHQICGDYIPFIILLLSLFTVTGGIRITGNVKATPLFNTLLLFAGNTLASFMGTTGAAMLMIRPLLEVNRNRTYKTHTILFFIALAANAGGILSPLGDPPLFLLYLRGAPFEWFLNLRQEWFMVGALLLVIYFVYDCFMYRKEPRDIQPADNREHVAIIITGKRNFLFLGMIMAAVIFLNGQFIPAMNDENAPFVIKCLREIALLAVVILSITTTPKQIRQDNNFSWQPIIEVGVLFAGIFVTMTPALLYLQAHAADLGLTEPWQFYYCTGALSSFLDNSPTAVAFHSVATGLYPTVQEGFVAGIPEQMLEAISLGAVFFGSMTYIGNGPNFMIKAIAEQNGVRMPGFFGYILTFSLVILLPVYIAVQLIFLP